MIGLGFFVLFLPVFTMLAFFGELQKTGLVLMALWFLSWGLVFA